MRLYLKNIGKLKEADIKLEGITVVAGENNSGKSTVGKALYAVYNTFCCIEEQLKYGREKSMTILENYEFPQVAFYPSIGYLKNYDKYVEETTFEQRVQDLFQLLIEQNVDIPETTVKEAAERFTELNSVTKKDFVLRFMKNRLSESFRSQFTNLYGTENSIFTLIGANPLEQGLATFTCFDNEILSCEGSLDFSNEALYVDNPFILDEMYVQEESNSHRNTLKSLLKKSPDKDQAITQILAEKKLKNVLALLNTVCEGELSFKNTITYRLGKTGKSLDIKNLSTGLKSFAILKTLLLNGALARGSVLILDEPEIHLHPEWQLVYAELIVLLQKEFKLTILLTTHSPYFLRALEVYAGKYEIADKCNYYFAKNEGQEAMIYDVTEDREQIYKKLARPLRDLENERLEIDD